jgi:SAM-dependent methyltransferase
LDTVAPDSFDAVFMNQVIEHIPGAAQLNAIREAYRILKPGGELYVGSPGKHDVREWSKSHISLLTPSELKVMLEDAGFTDCYMGYNRPMDVPQIPKEIVKQLWEAYHPDIFSESATVLAVKPEHAAVPVVS